MRKKSGQVLIVILLAMVIAVTVALSVASRSVTNLKTSTQIEEARTAYAAAESGIEDFLNKDLKALTEFGPAETGERKVPQLDISGGTNEAGSYNATVTSVGGISSDENENVFQTLNPVARDDTVQVILDKGPSICLDSQGCVTKLNVLWARAEDSDVPEASLEIKEVWADNKNTATEDDDAYHIEEYAVNADCSADVPGSGGTVKNNFYSPGAGPASGFNCDLNGDNVDVDGSTVDYSAIVTIDFGLNGTYSSGSKEPKLLRIKPLYNKTSIAVENISDGNQRLPLQGYLIESTGTFGSSTKKIQVFQPVGTLPAVFDYVLYSGQGISKQP